MFHVMQVTSEIAHMVSQRSQRISVESRRALKDSVLEKLRHFALIMEEFASLNEHDQVETFH